MQVKIALMSDSHCSHDQIIVPECDILIHAGDFSYRGSEVESRDFLQWLSEQTQAKARVYVCGNHEYKWDANKWPGKSKPGWLTQLFHEYPSLYYLEHESINLYGLNIFGSPYTPEFFPEYWGFNRSRGEELKGEWAKIPDNTDIIVSHGPAKGFLDWTDEAPHGSRYPGGHVGCADLFNRLYHLKQLKLVVTGHLHGNTGMIDIPMEGSRIVKYCNAAVVDNQYKVTHQPQIITLEV